MYQTVGSLRFYRYENGIFVPDVPINRITGGDNHPSAFGLAVGDARINVLNAQSGRCPFRGRSRSELGVDLSWCPVCKVDIRGHYGVHPQKGTVDSFQYAHLEKGGLVITPKPTNHAYAVAILNHPNSHIGAFGDCPEEWGCYYCHTRGGMDNYEHRCPKCNRAVKLNGPPLNLPLVAEGTSTNFTGITTRCMAVIVKQGDFIYLPRQVGEERAVAYWDGETMPTVPLGEHLRQIGISSGNNGQSVVAASAS